jgi:hypothetical protein
MAALADNVAPGGDGMARTHEHRARCVFARELKLLLVSFSFPHAHKHSTGDAGWDLYADLGGLDNLDEEACRHQVHDVRGAERERRRRAR